MMENSLVCKECRGSKQVAVQRDVRAIGDTGLSEWALIPQGTPDMGELKKVFPEVAPPGYQLGYAWGTIRKGNSDVPCVRVFMEKRGDAPSKSTVDLSGKGQNELIELAVKA